ncbi:hypothetical protein CRD15_09810 [Corynebacterium sp. LK28]|nr:hypothetical protein [Corynebacterium sp. LK28]
MLRENMIAKGHSPLRSDEAHHMVPARLNRGDAPALRSLFAKHDVSLNDAANGEFLPKTKTAGDMRLGNHGSGVHSNREYAAMYQRLKDSSTRDEFLSKLHEIRDSRQSGLLLYEL